MQWKSNARWNQDVKEGTIFTLKDDSVSISIHKIHGIGNDKWYLSCRTLGISQFGLNTEDFDLAVEDAKAIIQTKLEMLSQNFAGFLSDDTENKIVRY